MEHEQTPPERETNAARDSPDRKNREEAVLFIPLSDLRPFPNHPFKVREDDAMKETAESVREYGILTPAIVRPREGGGYEIISGHRRKHACELAGLDAMSALVREMDDDMAVIMMVDSNLQRENILPSERAQAYKMKLEAIKRRAGRPPKEAPAEDERNCAQVERNFSGKRSVEIVAQESGANSALYPFNGTFSGASTDGGR